MKFPILIIKQKKPSLFYFDEDEFGLVSKGGQIFYYDGTVIDCAGKIYRLKKSTKIKKAPFLKSLKYFQPMYKVEVNAQENEIISIDDFKNLIIEHIKTYENYWEKREPIDDLIKYITEMNNFTDIIKFLK